MHPFCIQYLAAENCLKHSAGIWGRMWGRIDSEQVHLVLTRCCAVYGGVYCLKRSIDALILSEPNGSIVSGIRCSNGQKIMCR